MKTKSLLLGLLALIISVQSFSQSIELGKKLIQYEQLNQAKKVFKKIYAAEPANAKALFYLGEIAFAQGKKDSADYYYKQGVAVDPKEAYNYIGVAKMFLDAGDIVTAETHISNAISKAKKDMFLYITLAKAYTDITKPDYRSAIENFDKAKDINYKVSDLYLEYGKSYFKQNKITEAINNFKVALDYNSNNAVAHYYTAIIKQKGRQYQDAATSLKQAVKIDSTYGMAYKELGEVFMLFAKYTEAAKYFKKYLSISEPDSDAEINYAYALFYSKNYELCKSQINKLSSITPNDLNINRLNAFVTIDNKETAKGLELIKTHFASYDTTKMFAIDYEYYAKSLEDNKLDSLAIPFYLKAVSKDTTRADLYTKINQNYERRKDYKSEALLLEKLMAKKANPETGDLFGIGRVYYLWAQSKAMKDPNEKLAILVKSDSAFAKLSRLVTTKPTAFQWRARVAGAMDPNSENGLAKPHYEKVISIITASPDAAKYTKELTEAYRYLVSFYYTKYNQTKSDAEKKVIIIECTKWCDEGLKINPSDKTFIDVKKQLGGK